VQKKIAAVAVALIGLTARPAHAQWFPYPYPGPVVVGYPPPGYYPGRNPASVRTQVTPRETQVFVDGYAAGVADDFDGVFQRLQLIPGQHEITFYLPGYRSHREDVYLNPGSSHTIRHTMVQHPPGESDDPAPVPMAPPAAAQGRFGPGPPPPPTSSGYGTLALRVQPGDAEITIDGEQWRSSQPQDRMTVELGEGRHHIEIRKSGFQPFSSDVEVRPGQTTSLNVSLLAQ
jgi:hypothetical protein